MQGNDIHLILMMLRCSRYNDYIGKAVEVAIGKC